MAVSATQASGILRWPSFSKAEVTLQSGLNTAALAVAVGLHRNERADSYQQGNEPLYALMTRLKNSHRRGEPVLGVHALECSVGIVEIVSPSSSVRAPQSLAR